MRALPWGALALLVLGPLAVAAASPLNATRQAVHVAGSLAGVAALGLLLVQPALASGAMPGLSGSRWRGAHRAFGAALAILVAAHVGGLWLTSPPDVVDALLLRSPTPFAAWGVMAMWAVAATALLAWRRRRLRPRTWRRVHLGLACVVALGTAVHALLIVGAMGPVTKAALCVAVVGATGALVRRRL